MSSNSELIRGAVEILILKLLSDNDMYGYQMIKTVNERSKGFFEWREGSLYPRLHRLECDELVVSYIKECGGRMRHYYSFSKFSAGFCQSIHPDIHSNSS